MTLIPDETIDVLRGFNNIAVDLYGIPCTLYLARSLNDLIGLDMYLTTENITFHEHVDQKVWIEWAPKNIERLRKLGVFAENEAPILGWFKMRPDITVKSYIKIPVRYIPDNYKSVDEFEIVNAVMINTYSSEVYRCFKLAPRREKV